MCGADLSAAAETWYGLCDTCRASIEQELAESREGESCDYCGRPLISEHDRCLSCRKDAMRSWDRVTVLFPYTGKYRGLLAAYKFKKNLAAGNYFTEKIREAIAHSGYSAARIVPVPPRPGKIRKAGWDQVEYLARLLERNYGNEGLLVDRCLKRMPSKSQKELGRENRRSNLRGRITAVRQAPQTAVVIDDVMTTGATLDACAAALKDAGTEKVYGLCLFYD